MVWNNNSATLGFVSILAEFHSITCYGMDIPISLRKHRELNLSVIRIDCLIYCSLQNVIFIFEIIQYLALKQTKMDASSESELEFQNTPPEIIESVQTITQSLLPQKSKDTYQKYYTHFMDWKEAKKTDSFSENVFLAYFHDLSTKWKSSTLWKTYSILKSTVNVKHDIDISKYKKVKAFLKRSSDKYSPRKSMVLTTENIKQFLEQAPDHTHLATKVG